MRVFGVFRNTVLTYSSRIASLLMLLAVNVAVSRGLGPGGRGQYGVLLLISTIVLLTGNLGTNISSLRSIQEGRIPLAVVASNAIVTVVVTSLAVGSLAVATFSFFVSTLYRGLYFGWVAIAVAGAVFLSVSMTNSYLLLAENRIVLVNIIDLIQSASLLIGVLVALLSRLSTLDTIMWIYLGSTVVTCVVSTLLVLRHLAPDWRALQWSLSCSLLKYGATVLPVNVFQLLNGRVALFLLNMWSTSAQLGYFAVAISMAELLRHFSEAVRTVMFGELALSSLDQAVRLARSAARWMIWVAGCGGVTMILLAKPFVTIVFSSIYLPVVPLLSYIVVGSVCLALASPLMSLLLMSGHGGSQTRASAIAMGLNVVLSIVLIPRLGMTAAAFAYSVSFFALAVAVYVDFFRYFGRAQGWAWLLPNRGDLEKLRLVVRVVTGVIPPQ